MDSAYVSLASESLKGGSQLEQGLQTTAIYWESWQTPFRGLLGGLYGGKWSWKQVDSDIRRAFRLDTDPSVSDAVVFFGVGIFDSVLARKYEGCWEFASLSSARKRPNYSFFPSGTNKL